MPRKARIDVAGAQHRIIKATYFQELVRYIHLNPLQVGLVSDLGALNRYSFSGQGVLSEKHKQTWLSFTRFVWLVGHRRMKKHQI